ncbi:hypothetical protein C4D60_Mb08t17970 [Musa balbisiana]|uniref:Uncharacterized protein n=1 Tax=Musa balbisiana TaxID=52838 RepID=A0A4S8K4K2_MUSBA|nr:hypothetical protein C4D60_Mb08t17970 [Musa balbisiana]
MEVRRGPWTLEEDTLLTHYIACHGEGRWNLLARCSVCTSFWLIPRLEENRQELSAEVVELPEARCKAR